MSLTVGIATIESQPNSSCHFSVDFGNDFGC
jgi:hypothetical protein